MAGIYLHIPFCKQACHYCNFHFSTQTKHIDVFVDALIKEIQQRHSYLPDKSLKTIYLGGGTPSLLLEDHLKTIFNELENHFEIQKDVEITLEANPDDISKEKLKYWQQLGVNRLSVGVQSFIERDLEQMNRAHSVQEADYSIKLSQDLGYDNITIDLMYGLPQLTNTEWQDNVQKAIDLKVPHISSYCLTLEEKTALNHFVNKGKIKMIGDETTEQQFLTLIQLLQKNGFEHYEISNFTKKGFISKHNSAYWLGERYLGLGPSAHSFDGENRGWNISNNPQYISKVNNFETYFEIEKLSPENKFNEYILTRLRTKWGIDLKEVEHHFSDFKLDLSPLLDKKWVKVDKEICTLTSKGKLLADQAAMELFV